MAANVRSAYLVRTATAAILTGFFVSIGVAVGSGQAAGPQANQRAGSPAPAISSDKALLNRYCVTCHNERRQTPAGAPLMLDKLNIDVVAEHPEVWEKVARKVRSGAMPPVSMPRPDAATLRQWVESLETALDRAAAAAPQVGRPARVHRLNRAEYANAVRDLLGLEVEGRELLPADDSGYGFDNIGDVLSVSPGLLERYMLAAAKIRKSTGEK
jgi:mono/diheme cytochrome c family protein